MAWFCLFWGLFSSQRLDLAAGLTREAPDDCTLLSRLGRWIDSVGVEEQFSDTPDRRHPSRVVS
jgi:hypothetical protein